MSAVGLNKDGPTRHARISQVRTERRRPATMFSEIQKLQKLGVRQVCHPSSGYSLIGRADRHPTFPGPPANPQLRHRHSYRLDDMERPCCRNKQRVAYCGGSKVRVLKNPD